MGTPTTVAVSDEELCQRVARRDRAAFDTLVERHQEKAYRLAWSILRDEGEARDLSQEAFLRVYQAAASFDGRSRFSTWFYRILVNLCIDYRRKNRWWRMMFASRAESGEEPATAELDRLVSALPGPDEEVSRKQTMKRLWKAVAQLSAKQRAALLLQVQEDLPAAKSP